MKINRLVLSLVLLLGATAASLGQDSVQTRRFSLAEAQQYAVANSYSTLISALDVTKAEKQVGETRAIGLPQINAKAEYTNFLNLATQLIPAKFFDPNAPDDAFAEVQFGTKHNMSVGVTASQLIFNGSYIVALRASSAYKQMSVIQHQRTQAEVRQGVHQAYVAVLVSAESVQVLDSLYAATQENFAQLRAMAQTGFLDQTEADQVELLLSNLDNQRLLSRAQYDIAQNLLKYNMGIPQSERVELSDSIEQVLAQFDLEAYLAAELALETNIDYQAARNQVRIAELSLSLERSAYLPSLAAFISQQWNANRNEPNFANPDEKWFPTSLLGITLNIPIFSGFERHYRTQKAKVDLLKAQTQMQQFSEGLRLDFATAKSSYANSYRVYANTQKDKDLAQKIYNRTLVKFRNGMASSIELQQTHNQYLQKETAYLMALQSFLDARAKLEKTLAKFENQ